MSGKKSVNEQSTNFVAATNSSGNPTNSHNQNSQIKKKSSKFDIVVSYEPKIKTKVWALYEILVHNYGLHVLMDHQASETVFRTPVHKKLLMAIMKAKMLLCCMTKEYTVSGRCKNELIVAYTSSKPILVLMFDNLDQKELDSVYFAINGSVRCFVYEHIDDPDLWSGALMAELTVNLQNILEQKLIPKDFGQKRKPTHVPKVDPYLSSNTTGDGKINENGLLADNTEVLKQTATRVKNIITAFGKDVFDENLVDSSSIKLNIKKTNSLLEFAIGYNRIAYLKSRKRYLVTSAYNGAIISLDTDGNWIDKRNPNGLLRQPYGICVNKNQEIFVGDNDLKCILVFDKDLKFLRKLAENVANGYFDMVYDDEYYLIYAINVYDSQVVVIDVLRNCLKSKFYCNAPLFIKLAYNQVFVVSADDSVYVFTKEKFETKSKIEIKNSKYLSGLMIISESILIVSAYEILEDKSKSRDVYLCIVKYDEIKIKKIKMSLYQINDIMFHNNILTCIDDTHFHMFTCENFESLFAENSRDPIINTTN